MTTLLELKEKLVRFYGKYEVYITPIVKFIVAFAALMTIDRNIGYMELVSSTPVALILGLLCAILPVGGTIFIAAVVILADMYALSIEVCLVALLLFVLIYFIYFRFAPRQGMGVLLTPMPITATVLPRSRSIYSRKVIGCSSLSYLTYPTYRLYRIPGRSSIISAKIG